MTVYLGTLVVSSAGLPDALKATSSGVESISKITYGPRDIEIFATSAPSSRGEVEDVAWGLTTVMGGFWSQNKGLRNDDGTIHLGLKIHVDTATYAMSYPVVTAIADGKMTREEWRASTA